MAAFVQIIEFKTDRVDQIRRLTEDFRSRLGGELPVRRGTLVADRDRPGYYLNIVEFDSYEAAMANSNRAETSEFAARLVELCDGPPKFSNLDVVDRWPDEAAR
jgi:hypothetical protein